MFNSNYRLVSVFFWVILLVLLSFPIKGQFDNEIQTDDDLVPVPGDPVQWVNNWLLDGTFDDSTLSHWEIGSGLKSTWIDDNGVLSLVEKSKTKRFVRQQIEGRTAAPNSNFVVAVRMENTANIARRVKIQLINGQVSQDKAFECQYVLPAKMQRTRLIFRINTTDHWTDPTLNVQFIQNQTNKSPIRIDDIVLLETDEVSVADGIECPAKAVELVRSGWFDVPNIAEAAFNVTGGKPEVNGGIMTIVSGTGNKPPKIQQTLTVLPSAQTPVALYVGVRNTGNTPRNVRLKLIGKNNAKQESQVCPFRVKAKDNTVFSLVTFTGFKYGGSSLVEVSGVGPNDLRGIQIVNISLKRLTHIPDFKGKVLCKRDARPANPRWPSIVAETGADYQATLDDEDLWRERPYYHQYHCLVSKAHEASQAGVSWARENGAVKSPIDFVYNQPPTKGSDVTPCTASDNEESCFVAHGIEHMSTEIAPAFRQYCFGSDLDFDDWNVDHQSFLEYAVDDCIDEVVADGEMNVISGAFAKPLVKSWANIERTNAQNFCSFGGQLPSFISEADVSQVMAAFPESTLTIQANGAFTIAAGSSLQLSAVVPTVSGDLRGNDSSAGNTVVQPEYSVMGSVEGNATITPEGLLTVHHRGVGYMGQTEWLFVFAKSGEQEGVLALAITDVDTDGDSLADSYERYIGFDPLTPDRQDTDGDGKDDATEILIGTDPEKRD